MGAPSDQPSYAVSVIAAQALKLWGPYLDPQGRCLWNLHVLTYAEDANALLVTEDNHEVRAAALIRYLMNALPRDVVFKHEAQKVRAAELRAEFRKWVGGGL